VSTLAAARQKSSVVNHRLAMTRSGQIVKRVMDLMGSAILLVFAAPLVAILALRIKFHDGGTAFFRRRVVSPKGEFDAFKLRTMCVDADEILRRDQELRRQFEINFKLKHDPRVTPLGATLRKSGLDELPQLWNVLKGEMSLVGPRMITPVELKKYGEAAWIFNSIKPGLTGYWQVHGNQEAGYDSRINMDLFYMENWSIWFDLKILMRTPVRVLRGSGV
jgi:lipopolysaccharide/colanic/teichoic acid biosynthesis glycosyltransferase